MTDGAVERRTKIFTIRALPYCSWFVWLRTIFFLEDNAWVTYRASQVKSCRKHRCAIPTIDRVCSCRGYVPVIGVARRCFSFLCQVEVNAPYPWSDNASRGPFSSRCSLRVVQAGRCAPSKILEDLCVFSFSRDWYRQGTAAGYITTTYKRVESGT